MAVKKPFDAGDGAASDPQSRSARAEIWLVNPDCNPENDLADKTLRVDGQEQTAFSHSNIYLPRIFLPLLLRATWLPAT